MPLDNIDPDLVDSCRNGDQVEFTKLYDELKDDLFRWIYSLMRNWDDAEEVFQECTIRLFRHIETLKDPKRFSHWLYRLVVNQCNTHRSRKHRRRWSELNEEIEVKQEDYVSHSTAPENPRQALSRKETMSRINDQISTLPEKQQMAVLLFDVEGYSIKEVADMMECSEGAVKFNIHEGGKKLRVLLEPMMERYCSNS